MARFYGWTSDVIENMDCYSFASYDLSIDSLKAEEDLRSIQVVCFPNMKRDKQKKVEKELRSKLDKNIESNKSSPHGSTEDLYHNLLRTLGNG